MAEQVLATASAPERGAARAGRGASRKNFQNNFWGWLFVTPQILGLLLFVLLPAVIAVYLCFAKWDIINPPEFVGWDNFRAVFTDERFKTTIVNTLVFVAGIVPANLVCALVLAVIAGKVVRLQKVYKAALFVPMITSTVAISLVWYWIYAQDFGILNTVLGALGIPQINFLRDEFWAKPAIILMCVWRGVGYSFLILLAAINNVPKDYYEAADLDGAGELSKFFHITFPGISQVVFFVLVTSFISTFGIFNESFMLTGGGPNYKTYTMMYYVYNYAFRYNADGTGMGIAAVAALVMAFFQIIVTIVQFKLSKVWVK